MGHHLTKDGLFQSDKYPGLPAGKVAFSLKDKAAQGLLWEIAQRYKTIDKEFGEDLEQALKNVGYDPETDPFELVCPDCERLGNATFAPRECMKHGIGLEPRGSGG